MNLPPLRRLIVPLLLTSGLTGCISLPGRHHWAAIRPVTPAPSGDHQMSQADTYYLNASSAIYRRDYALALDLLQIARMKKPGDVRVMNAFGVVYDKLGRFDLSARYYGEAAALDPNSTVVRNNLAYSQRLQGKASDVAALASAAPVSILQSPRPAAPAPTLTLASTTPSGPATEPTAPNPSVGRVVVMGPGVVRLEFPTSPPPIRALAALTGHPLVLVNASGQKDGVEPLRVQLASLGWSTPRIDAGSARAQATTTIRYPRQDAVAAQALARTLPGAVELAACDDGCQNIQLTVGANALTWKLNSRGPGAGRHPS